MTIQTMFVNFFLFLLNVYTNIYKNRTKVDSKLFFFDFFDFFTRL